MDGSIEDIQKLRGHNLPFFDHLQSYIPQHGHFFNLNVYKNRRFCKPSIHMLSTYFLNAPLKNNAYCAMHTFYLSILTEIVFCYYRFLDFLWENFFMLWKTCLLVETGIKKIWSLYNSFIDMTDLSQGFPYSFYWIYVRSVNATTFIDMYYYFVVISALHMHTLIVNFESWIRWIIETISEMKGKQGM